LLVAALAPSPAVGAPLLSQLPGRAGCFVPGPAFGDRSCGRGSALFGPDSVVVTSDGRGVYAVARDPDHLLDVGSSALLAFDRDPATGALRQRGCVSDDAGDGREGTDGVCLDGDALQSANDIAASPDGRSLYITSDLGALAIFERDPAAGTIREAGCLKDWAPDSRCDDVDAMERPVSVAVSPDGANVYVTSRGSQSIVAFGRDPRSGLLRQLSCVSDTGLDGRCSDARALVNPTAIAISPDGRNAYVTTAKEQNGLAVFARDLTTGALTQTGCFISGVRRSLGCTATPGLLDASSVAVSPDGLNVYVTAIDSDAITTFRRDPETGALTALGCIAGSDGLDTRRCRHGRKLSYAADVAVTPDGRAVVLVAAGDDAIAVYARNRQTGRLSRRTCLEYQREGGPCGRARGIFGPKGLALSPRADNVYVTADTGNAVAAFRLRLGQLK
jgi:DNA-binding beta-propeller fold protein YncE